MNISSEPVEGVRYFPALVDPDLGSRIKSELLKPSAHGPAEILVDGGSHQAPRLVSSYSDQVLRLDGMEDSLEWTDELRELRDLIAGELGLTFNYALANLYRNEDDYTGWHSDKAALHAEDSSIVIVSFGATRRLSIRSYVNPDDVVTLELEECSAVMMNLAVQVTHEHAVLREPNHTNPRLSITLRKILVDPGYLRDAAVT